MTAGEILRQQAKARGFSDEDCDYAEKIVRATSPGYLEREIPEKDLPEFIAKSNVIQNMPTRDLKQAADRMTARN